MRVGQAEGMDTPSHGTQEWGARRRNTRPASPWRRGRCYWGNLRWFLFLLVSPDENLSRRIEALWILFLNLLQRRPCKRDYPSRESAKERDIALTLDSVNLVRVIGRGQYLEGVAS